MTKKKENKKKNKKEAMTFAHLSDPWVRKKMEADKVPSKADLKKLVNIIASAFAEDEGNPDVSYEALDWREAAMQAASDALEAGELAECYQQVRKFWQA